jgi:RHH-type proline utilization regulon transcriptional repressor/proline dehydrogenase/delta 1-pyrroline-5-carboxylate dehydrogenase
VPGETNVTEYLPRGIAGVISPWNFPVAILLGMTAGALVTGNAVLMKPAEQTPICALRLFDLLREAGVPPGVLHYLPGRGEVTGARIVEHPEVATIAFTGSRTVGQLIALRAIETSHAQAGLKRVIAEMGGKNAIIVDHDADLDQAVPGILASAFGYGGQKCSACSRVIVHRSVYEAFVARSVDAARALAVGPAQDPRTSVGPLIDDEAVARVRDAIEEGKRVARLALEVDVGPLRARGHFVGPVIFADVPEACSLAQEEVFGPVLAVLAARDLDDAIRIANATPYALTGGIYSRGPRSIAKARSELLVGNLYINRGITGALVARQPFGGFRASGVGYKAGGRDYLLQHLVARTVTENTLRQGFAPES